MSFSSTRATSRLSCVTPKSGVRIRERKNTKTDPENLPTMIGSRLMDLMETVPEEADTYEGHLEVVTTALPRMIATQTPDEAIQTLPELVSSYLSGRPLPAELDRGEFVRLGQELMDLVERDLAGG